MDEPAFPVIDLVGGSLGALALVYTGTAEESPGWLAVPGRRELETQDEPAAVIRSARGPARRDAEPRAAYRDVLTSSAGGTAVSVSVFMNSTTSACCAGVRPSRFMSGDLTTPSTLPPPAL